MRKIGIYNPYLETRGGGEKVCTALAEALSIDKNNRVFFITHGQVDLDELAKYFKVDLSRVDQCHINLDRWFISIIRFLHLPGMVKNLFYDLVTLRSIKKYDFDLFVNNYYQSNLPSPVKNSVYMCMFPQRLRNDKPDLSNLKRIYLVIVRFIYRLCLHPLKKHPIDTYPTITANSKFTQKYISEFWQRDSTVLYPICDNMSLGGDGLKKNLITSVGRFFKPDKSSHNKRHDVLIDAFSKMKDLHNDGWQLHLVGSLASGRGMVSYINSLRKKAEGSPIYFHFDSSFENLKKLYNDSKVYWHATGFGSNSETYPEKQEHFGITTVEAMSAGNIPIVINSAGQKEIVEQKKNGFLWSNLGELARYTRDLAKFSPAELNRLRRNAEKTAESFDKNSFQKRVNYIFSDLLKQ